MRTMIRRNQYLEGIPLLLVDKQLPLDKAPRGQSVQLSLCVAFVQRSHMRMCMRTMIRRNPYLEGIPLLLVDKQFPIDKAPLTQRV